MADKIRTSFTVNASTMKMLRHLCAEMGWTQGEALDHIISERFARWLNEQSLKAEADTIPAGHDQQTATENDLWAELKRRR